MLVLLAALFFGYIFYMGKSRGPEIARRVTAFMTLASNLDAEGAHDFLIDKFQEEKPLDAFAQMLEDQFGDSPPFAAQKQTGYFFSIRVLGPAKYNIFNLARIYEYQGVATYADGREGDIKMVFIREGGQWKLISFHIRDPHDVF